ncbi:MAG: DUF3843 family protein [Bacteroidales bacterium]|nr:DUF3843 family protein [Bacteroidales bacterium]
MNIKKIYPIDWREMHPEGMRADSDQYFTGIANRVANILAHSDIDDAFTDSDELRDAAMRLTAYFEDICTGIGFWKTLNDTCCKRYGKLLPFYDTSDYAPAEPNVQDVQLLLWDIIQSNDDNRFINPENPGIVFAANDIYGIFDREYETADDTPELVDYLHDPAITTDFWQMRKRLEWIFTRSYINLRGRIDFEGALEEIEDIRHFEEEAYIHYTHHLFSDRHNLAILTPAEWLSVLSGQRVDIDTSIFYNRCYEVTAIETESLRVRDLVNGIELSVENYSFEERWIKKFRLDKSNNKLLMGLVRWNDKYYQCGSMLEIPSTSLDGILEQVRQRDYKESLMASNEEQFRKASGGESIVFLKGMKQLEEFYAQKMRVPLTGDFLTQMRDTVRECTEDGMVALMGTPDEGILIITGYVPAIKHKNNPFYDPDYARKQGQGLLMNPMAVDYSAVCTMIDQGMLSDIAINSLRGPEYGHMFLQNNIQYVADYSFAEHR